MHTNHAPSSTRILILDSLSRGRDPIKVSRRQASNDSGAHHGQESKAPTLAPFCARTSPFGTLAGNAIPSL